MTDHLTTAQRAAVEHFEGPVMVLAGPGSGKTRVITHRIARLLERGVRPDEILAVTFTNKAAREMSARVHRLLGGMRVAVGTFHRFCSSLLRAYPDYVGLKNNFTILDTSDQVQLLRGIMNNFGLSTSTHDPQRVLNRISRARNHLISAEEFRQQYEQRIGDPLDAVVYQVFEEYEQRLLHQNCVDFDALLLHAVDMLSQNEELRASLDAQFRFVLVDEYQDTNLAQYRIIAALSQQHANLCSTGDPDQSIYGWRGARPENLVQFEQDFPGTRIIALDQNFRSTAAIVRCADQLISHNPRRHRGRLTTANPEGEPARLHVFADAEAEANGIAAKISECVRQGKQKYSDFAVFYRINALSRALETALSRHVIPFQVASGYSFYERAEVRDLLGYLRLIENRSDDTAFQRIVNRPIRGIGDKTLNVLAQFAQQEGSSLLAAAERCDQISGLTNRSRKPLKLFVDLIQRLRDAASHGSVAALIERLLTEINYLSLWKDDNDEVDQDRKANVYELVNAARLYEEAQEEADLVPSLQGFLELATLTNEADNIDESKGAVTLMTMHAAKGLEFPVVYIVGVESGLIPHERAVRNGDPASFQEERRLLYVGVTRAMHELHLTQTRQRDFRGMRRSTIGSPFLSEMILEVVCDDDEFPPMRQRMQPTVNEHVAKARQRYDAAQQGLRGPMIMSAADLERRLRDRATAGGPTEFPEESDASDASVPADASESQVNERAVSTEVISTEVISTAATSDAFRSGRDTFAEQQPTSTKPTDVPESGKRSQKSQNSESVDEIADRPVQDAGAVSGADPVPDAKQDDSVISRNSRHVVQSVMRSIARLEEKPENSRSVTGPFPPGMHVRHPRYGRGIVIGASSESSRATVTVLFEAGGREETFVTAHCPLQPAGNSNSE